MPRRVSVSQLRSQLRQAQQRQQRAIDDYNRKVRQHNDQIRRRVDAYNRAAAEYNRKVQAHNQQVARSRERLRSELNRLASSPAARRYVIYSRSVTTVRQAFSALERAAESGEWRGSEEFLGSAEAETASSVATLLDLEHGGDDGASSESMPDLRMTSILPALESISADLAARWRGALYSLSPDNPDAGRHFCTSAREILTRIIDGAASDDEVRAADAGYSRTPDGGVSRRARIHFVLARTGNAFDELEAFVDADIENVLDLFGDFNAGTHGEAGRFALRDLTVIKRRVEDAVLFLHRFVVGSRT